MPPTINHTDEIYINGCWVKSKGGHIVPVINPATEEVICELHCGTENDVDEAARAARAAFASYAHFTIAERGELFSSIVAVYEKRQDELAALITTEMGAPLWLSKLAQAKRGLDHFIAMAEIIKNNPFEQTHNGALILKEPIGVCGLITPWNWPINQIACKVVPALAAGCTMVLKPSEVAPLNAIVFTEILHEAGVPKGVFNLVQGEGADIGAGIARHKEFDMVSFTGSTRAGVEVAIAAAPSVKRVTQELGGKSPNIILDDADFEKAIIGGVKQCFLNSGQSCNAPTRMLVPHKRLEEAEAIAKKASEQIVVGDPLKDGTHIGPLASETQFQRVQSFINTGIEEGAHLLTGGVGRPEGLARGFYAKPTIFTRVHNQMSIAREEIFGPVLSILSYETEAEAITIANDTPYGLAAYVSGAPDHAKEVARALRAGTVSINGATADIGTPFGGYKQSGNGREWGLWGLEEFLEVKAITS